jgi:DNA-binding CsgD family transcriptional regulator
MLTAPTGAVSEERLAEVILAAGSAEFFPALTRYLLGVVPFQGVFVTRLSRRKRPLHIYDNVRAERRVVVIDQYLDAAYLLDPFYDAFRASPESRVMRLGDVAPDRFQHSTYFRRYYGNLRLRDELAIFVGLGDDSVLFYSLGRHTGESRFRQREVQAFRRALPVIRAVTLRHFGDRLRDDPATGTAPEIVDAMIRFGDDLLTVREREIAGMVLKGHSTASIAERTDIAVGTVKIHRKNIYRKLGISSQSELFSMFLSSLFA